LPSAERPREAWLGQACPPRGPPTAPRCCWLRECERTVTVTVTVTADWTQAAFQ